MIKAYALLIIVTGMLFTGGIFLLSKGGQSEEEVLAKVKFYQKTDLSRPVVEVIGPKNQDLGSLSVKSERSATFKVKNSGNQILQIYAGTSSCNCTFGQVSNGNNQSPLFGMHNKRKFLVELAPGEEGQVAVIYRPYLMPNLGPNTRTVTIKTNDPNNPEVEFSIDVTVY